MRIKTKELMDRSWQFLRFNLELNGFSNQKEFQEEWSELGEVAGDGSYAYFTRVKSTELFQPGNVKLINVTTDRDYEKVLVPSIGGNDYE